MRGSPFFEGVRQVDVVVGGEPAKVPCFYYDAFSMTATFPARLGALRALMPDSAYVPARLAPGVGLITIDCLEYRDTDVGPYNEVGIYVALNAPGEGANLPGRALWRATRSGRYHAYVHQMPVTTDVSAPPPSRSAAVHATATARAGLATAAGEIPCANISVTCVRVAQAENLRAAQSRGRESNLPLNCRD